MMTSWQRIKMALEHGEPDRVPIGYYATPEAHAALKQSLGISDDEVLCQRLVRGSDRGHNIIAMYETARAHRYIHSP